jgi:hypothetical protein
MAKQTIESSSNMSDFDIVLDVETLAQRQGVRPFNFALARELGKFWPDDERIDDFVATVRRWRDEEGEKEQP